jgi:ParB family chromosome partitioning protein
MSIDSRIVKVPATQINFDDKTYALRPDKYDDVSITILESVKRAGILRPPILKEESSRSFQIVDGWKRLHAVFNVLKSDACHCIVLPAQSTESEVLAFGLESILIDRDPTPVEKAIFFQKIVQCMELEEAANRFLPLFNLQTNTYHIKNLLRLLQLEEPLLLALHEGFLNEAAAKELVDLPFPDRMALFEIIDFLSLSTSNQKKIIQLCKELANRTENTVLGILSDAEIRDTILHPQSNNPQKTAKIMAILAEKRNPRLTAAEKGFRQFVGKLDLGKDAQVAHSPSFEKNEVSLSISFPTQNALETAWPAIKKILSGNK